ncbi:substrate-binding domain-containing protein [Arthrobacter sp. D2-10]
MSEVSTMLPRTRHKHILREIELHGTVRSADVAEKLGVNSVTIRRDIAELDAAGLLTKVHGGALAVVKARRPPESSQTLVGVLVPSTTSYFPEVVRGMESMAASRRVRLVLGLSHYDREIEKARVERLLALGVEGLILAPTIPEDVSSLVDWLSDLPVPVVLLERVVDGLVIGHEFEHVRSDHAHGASLAVRHLAQLGHRRIRLALYDRTPTARWVKAGYFQAVERFGIEDPAVHVLPKGDDDPRALNVALAELIEECRTSGTRAVLVHTDHHAAQLVELADSMGISVPEDLAVVAYDDELAEFAHVPLTAVTPPRREVGRGALRLLLERMEAKDAGRPVRHLQLLPRLTVRASCGAGKP